MLVVIAVAYFPGILLMIGGHAPTGVPAVKFTMFAGYFIIFCSAVFYKFDYRYRTLGLILVGYSIAFVGGAVFPLGSFIRNMPVTLPMLTLVLLGVRAGRIAALTSVFVVLVIPQVSIFVKPFGILDTGVMELSQMRKVLLTQGIALTAQLIILVTLLDRFHSFLMKSLLKLEGEKVERKRLEQEVARAGEEECHRLGLEIHDGVCQQLTGALLLCEALSMRLNRGDTLDIGDVDTLSNLLGDTYDEAHSVAKGLYALDDAPDAFVNALPNAAFGRNQRL